MTERFPWRVGAGRALLTCALLGLAGSPASAQDMSAQWDSGWQAPLFPRDLALRTWAPPLDDDHTSGRRTARIRLFRIPPGFLNTPVELDQEDDPLDGPDSLPLATPGVAGSGERLQLALGSASPYLDFRWHGDPGGSGFYKVDAQYQLFDTGTTSCALGLQGQTPAGPEQGGVEEGPTYVSPSLAWYHALAGGCALQGFVGRNMRANTRSVRSGYGRSLHYGLALQQPLAVEADDPHRGLFFFVEALGRYRYDDTGRPGPAAQWDVVPGLHYRMGEKCWLSGGYLMPIGQSGEDPRRWQFTCSWQF